MKHVNILLRYRVLLIFYFIFLINLFIIIFIYCFNYIRKKKKIGHRNVVRQKCRMDLVKIIFLFL